MSQPPFLMARHDASPAVLVKWCASNASPTASLSDVTYLSVRGTTRGCARGQCACEWSCVSKTNDGKRGVKDRQGWAKSDQGQMNESGFKLVVLCVCVCACVCVCVRVQGGLWTCAHPLNPQASLAAFINGSRHVGTPLTLLSAVTTSASQPKTVRVRVCVCVCVEGGGGSSTAQRVDVGAWESCTLFVQARLRAL
jgi:hypothetical protein